jgi:hypothetical protein
MQLLSPIFKEFRQGELVPLLKLWELKGYLLTKCQEWPKISIKRLLRFLIVQLSIQPLFIADAVYLKVCDYGKYVSKAVLIIAGIRSDGYHEFLGLSVTGQEDERFLRALFESLKERGLKGE